MLFHLFLETVVLDDDLTIKIVEVRGGITAAIELHHRTEIRRNDRKNRQNHPFRFDPGTIERLENFKTFDGLDATLILLTDGTLEILGNRFDLLGDVDVAKQLQNSFGADAKLRTGITMNIVADREEIERLRELADMAQVFNALGIVAISLLQLAALENFSFNDNGEEITGRLLIENLTIFENLGDARVNDDMGDEINDFLKLLGRDS